jgi:competence ComEA-like helix-hairpin-helix protein
MSCCRHDKYSFIGGMFLLTVAAIAKFMIAKPLLFTILIIGICIPAIFIAKYLLDKDNKNSIKEVPAYYIKGINTISNTHCTVKFYENDKIIVMDNIPDTKNKKRMFTKQLNNKYKINRYWADTCRIFDDKSSIDTLAPFLDVSKEYIFLIDAGIRKREVEKTKFVPPKPPEINIDNSNIGPKFVDISNVTPDKFGQPQDTSSKQNEEFVNINSLSEQSQMPTLKEEDTNNLVEFSDTLQANSKKIEINLVSAAELSVLPGINIVKAKKLIEYRNSSGYFKTIEDFLKVAEVKEHFAKKIKELIKVSIPKDTEIEEETEERIVDF